MGEQSLHHSITPLLLSLRVPVIPVRGLSLAAERRIAAVLDVLVAQVGAVRLIFVVVPHVIVLVRAIVDTLLGCRLAWSCRGGGGTGRHGRQQGGRDDHCAEKSM